MRSTYTVHYKVKFLAAVVFCCALFCSAAPCRAQDEKFEIGAHYTAFKFDAADGTDSGVGARLGYHLNDYLSVEGEANFFADTSWGNSGSGQKTQAFAGVRAGIRNKRFGVFGKVRPGAMKFYELSGVTPGCLDPGGLLVCDGRRNGRTRFALDVGAVFEVYPSRRTIIRVDAGNTLVRFKSGDVIFSRNSVAVFDGFRENLQISLGFGYRF